jgi:hypothetical protein
LAKYKNTFPQYDRLTYIQNPGLTEKLYYEFDHTINLLNQSEEEKSVLETSRGKLSNDKNAYILIIESILPTAKGTFFKYFITLFATSLVNVGINLITGGQLKFDLSGIIVIGIGLFLSFVVFYPDFRNTKKKIQEMAAKAKISNE